jgi:predicted transposase YbfD/YdcC
MSWPVKENQALLHARVKTLLEEAILQKFKGLSGDQYTQVGKDHGRREKRTCWSTPEVHHLKGVGRWPGLKSVLAVESTRTTAGKTTTQRRYFISSLDGEDAQVLARAVRMHWGIENTLHWTLDVQFKEDQSRTRRGHGDENLSRLRRIALNMLQRETSEKCGI